MAMDADPMMDRHGVESWNHISRNAGRSNNPIRIEDGCRAFYPRRPRPELLVQHPSNSSPGQNRLFWRYAPRRNDETFDAPPLASSSFLLKKPSTIRDLCPCKASANRVIPGD